MKKNRQKRTMDVKKESMKLLEAIEDKETLQMVYDYLLTVNKASTQSFSDWFGRNPAEYELYCRMLDYEREYFEDMTLADGSVMGDIMEIAGDFYDYVPIYDRLFSVQYKKPYANAQGFQ